MMKKVLKQKREKGITLVALAVTIIVLLILAGIAISLSIGNNGLFSRAKNAVEKHSEAEAREKLELALSNISFDKNLGEVDDEYIDTELERQGMVVIGDIVIVGDWQFEIDRSVPKVGTSLGKGVQNEEIQISSNVQLRKDYVNATIKLELTYKEGSIKEITINGEVKGIPELVNGVYSLEEIVTENGIYTVLVKDENGNYKIGKVEVKDITEDMEIWNKADMESFRDKVNTGRTFEGKTAKLMDDIDLEGSKENQWTPIDNFRGTFEGNKKSIKNLYMDNDTTANAGLFANVINAKIENVSIVSGKISLDKSSCVGSIAGEARNTRIYNCQNYINITSGGSTGGIIGVLWGKEIMRCGNSGEITGHAVGGICGDWNSASEVKTELMECYNTSDIKVIDGVVTRSHCGGGIIGKTMDVIIKFENCYNTGNVTTTVSKTDGYTGGIIGFLQYQNYKGKLDMINCYNTGNNTGNSQFKGGIIGFISNENSSTINKSNNYWLTGVGSSYGIGQPASNTGTISKNANGMKTIENDLGDKYTNDEQNTDGTWKYNGGYPILKWQLEQ